ncbi:MAG: oxidoreductase, partial [Acidimicrobiia bacterium]|nr:oxidoreductase [Acidimicrobiia bacterium]
ILARDSRSVPQFVYDPTKGEMYSEIMNLGGNPNPDRDWYQKVSKKTGRKYAYTVAHYATTEARFRRHFKPAKDLDGTVPLEQILNVVTQNDVIQRSVFDPEHFTFVPDFGVTIDAEDEEGNVRTLLISRLMVLFCVERRRSWRMLQSRAAITNVDYEAQKSVRKTLEAEEIGPGEVLSVAAERMREELAAVGVEID